jgi:Tfp pilus assembly protein PilF
VVAGVGFAWANYRLDYAFQPFGVLATAHRIALTYAGGVASAGPRSETPSSAQDAYQAALGLYNTGDYDGAWRKVYEAIQADSGNAEAWQLLGNCQYAKGDKEGALTSYRTSLQLNSHNAELRAWIEQVSR